MEFVINFDIGFDQKLIIIINIRPVAGFEPQLFERRIPALYCMTTMEIWGVEQVSRHDLTSIDNEDGCYYCDAW